MFCKITFKGNGRHSCRALVATRNGQLLDGTSRSLLREGPTVHLGHLSLTPVTLFLSEAQVFLVFSRSLPGLRNRAKDEHLLPCHPSTSFLSAAGRLDES